MNQSCNFGSKVMVALLSIILVYITSAFVWGATYKIMPLGDSITQGESGSEPPVGGFRDDLNSLLNNESVDFNYVGSQQDGLGLRHEGHNGWTADQLNGNVSQWLSTYNPNIVLLHIGTNDITAGEEVDSTIAEIESIVEKIHNYDPSTWILICSLIPRTDSKDELTTSLNSLIQNMFYNKKSLGYRIYYIGQNEVFKSNPNWATEYLSGTSSVHPNNTGYHAMADVFFNALMVVINSANLNVTDNFNRTELGDTWQADPEFQIVQQELSNTSTVDSWDFLATYIVQTNPLEVSFKWGTNANSEGINGGGLALRLDAPSANANGYLAWIHSGNLDLYTIENGQPTNGVDSKAGLLPAPQAGDEFRVALTTDEDGHHFDYYINGQVTGTLTDPQKRWNSETYYAGVMLKGNLNNNIDDFALYSSTIVPSQTDDFNDPNTLTQWWNANPAYRIANGVLENYDGSEWGQLAVFVADLNPPGASLKWAPGADAAGIDKGGIALLLTSQSYATADGYLATIRTQVGGDPALYLFTLVDGAAYELIASKTITGKNKPGAGDVFKVAVASDASGHHFSYYVNGSLYGQLDDPQKRYSNGTDYYMGIELYGGSNNNVDEFTTNLSINPSEPSNIEKVKPLGTPTGVVGSVLSDSLIVRVTDNSGKPVSGVNVDFQVTKGGGQVDSQSRTTDALGQARAQFTLGPVAGENQVEATAPDYTLSGSPVVFIITGNKEPVVSQKVDDFNDPNTLTQWWNAHPAYRIANGVLENYTGSDWGQLAVFKANVNPTEASLTWAPGADAAGIDKGGITLLLDSQSYSTANGYLATIRTQVGGNPALYLFSIVTGAAYDLIASTTVTGKNKPVAGDVFKVAVSSDASGHHFSYYVNGSLYGQLDDPQKQYGNSTTYYMGIELYGGLNNAVDQFKVATPVGDPDKIVKVKPLDTATGIVGSVLADSLIVRVTDKSGKPVEGVNVDFQVTKGGGQVNNTTAKTDIFGQARVRFTLGPAVGENRVEATAPDYTLSGSPVVFIITGVEEPSGDNFSAPNTLTQFWNAHPAYRIANGVLENYTGSDWGQLAVFKANVNPTEASLTWAPAADAAGIDKGGIALLLTSQSYSTANGYLATIRTQVGGDPVLCLFTIVKGAAYELIASKTITGKNKPVAGDVFKAAVVSNVSGHHFSYYVNGSLYGQLDDPQKRYSNGTDYYMGIELYGGLNNDVDQFETAQFVIAEPAKIAKVKPIGTPSGTVGSVLADSLIVRVTDTSNKPVSNVIVDFQVTKGGGQVDNQSSITDALGQARARFTLGTVAGENRVEATVPGYTLSGSPVVFIITGNKEPVVSQKVDDFNDPNTLTQWWNAHPAYRISNGVLENYTGSDWGQLAVFKAKVNPPEASLKWAPAADAAGIDKGGIALLLDSQSYSTANGYLATIRTQVGANPAIYLFTIVKGAAYDLIDSETLTGYNKPVGGNVFKVAVSSDASGHHFSYYVNGSYYGQLDDPQKLYSNGTDYYMGIELYGGLNNAVDQFMVATPVGDPDKIVKVKPLGTATGIVGRVLADSLIARVTDKSGNLISYVDVNFKVTKGGGQVNNTTTKTDILGQARAQFTLGTVAGENRVEAMVSGYTLSETPAVFIIKGNADVPVSMVASSPANQTGVGGKKLAQPFEVTLKDKYSNAARDYEIIFTITEGDGFLLNGEIVHKVKSDSSGKAQTYLTLGTETATNKVVAGYSTLPTLTFTATATSGIANALQYTSGNSQSAKVGTTLPNPLSVKVVDNKGNPVINHNVHFQIKAGGGSLVPVAGTRLGLDSTIEPPDPLYTVNSLPTMDVLTNETGLASVRLVVGFTAGVNTVQATSNAGGAALPPVDFNATAIPDVPDSLIEVSGNNQTGVAGLQLSSPFIVKITDQHNNPIYGHSVRFAVQAGEGFLDGTSDRIKTVLTNTEGKAQVFLTLGTKPDVQNKVAAEANSGNPPTPLKGSPITFTAVPGVVTKIQAKSPLAHTGSAGWPLADSLQVYIKDNYNNAVGGYPVTFRSTEGDNPGTFNGYTAQQIIVKTDSKGIARVMFYSGAKPGVASLAKAIAEGLTGSPITFTVTVAELAELKYVDGDLQTGAVGAVLAKPFTASVVDVAGKAIPKFDITFKVVKGDGNLSGNSSVTVKTDTTAKTAAATLTLGKAPGDTNNVVEASAIYKSKALKGSPIRYRASAAIGDASELKEVSGNYQREVVGNPLEKPLVVRITDTFGNSFTGHPVTFTIKTGGGYLDGAPSKKTVTKNSSDSGKVQVMLTLGTVSGQNNNSVEIVSYKAGTQTHLKNSPMTYVASATASPAHSLEIVSGTNQARSSVRQALSQPFVVKVLDRLGNPVPDHPVQWQCVQGNGTFDGLTDSLKTVNTNQSGVAQVYYYPGPLAGLQNVVRARSWNQVEISGSPRTFVVDTKEGAISASRSDVSAASPIPADGVTQSKITVTLMDDWGNKISGKALTLSPPPTGSNNTYTSFSELTNANGQAYAYLASTRAELKIIKVKEFSGVQLLDTAQVKFTPLDAQGISYVSGTDQTGNFGTAAKDKIKARVYDKNGNPISAYPVFFEAYEGGGYVWECRESKPVFTDQSGVASASWILGPSAEVNRARANAEGLAGSGSVRYIATAHSGTAKKIEKGSGDTQTGTAGLPLNNPLVVKVVDSAGDPIYNYPVKFKVTFGGGNFNDASIVTTNTDPFGEAARYLTLGRIAGANVTSVEAPDLAGSPIGFTSQGMPGAAAKVVPGAGEGKTGPVGGQISGIQVKVTDIYDNAVGGYTVNFAVNKGNASIIGSGAVQSGPNGIASISINVGNAVGEIEILAAAAGLIGDGLKIKVYAVAATAVSMTISNGNNQQGTIERELVYPLSVAVLDQYGNPAGGQNVPISFVVTQGNGILLNGPTVYADEKGIASARFQLGNVAGSNYQVWAINNALTGSPLEFKANGVTNKFPLITPIPPVTIRENQNITFTVNATDDDNDPIKFGVRSLPQGALFDSLGTKQFSWTPNYFQSGGHEVHFIAKDNKSGFDDELVFITVENVNRMPQISYYEPIAQNLAGHKNIGESFRFVVQVNDPDNDEITYQWFNNDILASSKNYYDFYVANEQIGSHYIVVKVSDGHDTVQRDWAIYIKTPVELANFSGRIIERHGIELEWETTIETAHAGFNVYRRSASEKEYEQINGNLIKADGTKKYHHIDRTVTVGETYFYKLEDVSLTGEKTQHDPITLFVTKPDEYRLYQNYPNPFNPKTHIDYQLPEPSRVTIRIFNIIGQEVRTLVDETKTVGYHSVMWNGLDNFGTPATSGIYYYRMETNSFVEVKKMVLLR